MIMQGRYVTVYYTGKCFWREHKSPKLKLSQIEHLAAIALVFYYLNKHTNAAALG